jgi:hypothetical protein
MLFWNSFETFNDRISFDTIDSQKIKIKSQFHGFTLPDEYMITCKNSNSNNQGYVATGCRIAQLIRLEGGVTNVMFSKIVVPKGSSWTGYGSSRSKFIRLGLSFSGT